MCKPITLTISSLLMNLTGQQHSTSDQHKEFGNSRQQRDCSDTQKVIKFLEKSSPFKVNQKFLLSKISDFCLCLFLFNSMWQRTVGERSELFCPGVSQVNSFVLPSPPSKFLSPVFAQLVAFRLVIVASQGSPFPAGKEKRIKKYSRIKRKLNCLLCTIT
jgi:hypothetical protein